VDVRSLAAELPGIGIPINVWQAWRAYKYGAAYHQIAKAACSDGPTRNPLACAFAAGSLAGHNKKKATKEGIAAAVKTSLLALEHFVPFAGSAAAGVVTQSPLGDFAIEQVVNGAVEFAMVEGSQKAGAKPVKDKRNGAGKADAATLGLTRADLRVANVRAALMYLTMNPPPQSDDREKARMTIRRALGVQDGERFYENVGKYAPDHIKLLAKDLRDQSSNRIDMVGDHISYLHAFYVLEGLFKLDADPSTYEK
jgi:hypothetical protein